MVMPEKAMAPLMALSRSMTADFYRTRVFVTALLLEAMAE